MKEKKILCDWCDRENSSSDWYYCVSTVKASDLFDCGEPMATPDTESDLIVFFCSTRCLTRWAKDLEDFEIDG